MATRAWRSTSRCSTWASRTERAPGRAADPPRAPVHVPVAPPGAPGQHLGPLGAGTAIDPAVEAAHGPCGIDTSSHTNPAESSGAHQAEFFVANGGGWSADGRTLPGALDMEYNPYGPVCYGLDHAQMDAWVRDFVGRYQQLTGVKPVIYTNADWWNTCVGRADYSDVHLWLARYDATPGTAPWSWSDHGASHTVWQTRPVTDKGYDVNRFHGDRAALQELAAGR